MDRQQAASSWSESRESCQGHTTRCQGQNSAQLYWPPFGQNPDGFPNIWNRIPPSLKSKLTVSVWDRKHSVHHSWCLWGKAKFDFLASGGNRDKSSGLLPLATVVFCNQLWYTSASFISTYVFLLLRECMECTSKAIGTRVKWGMLCMVKAWWGGIFASDL